MSIQAVAWALAQQAVTESSARFVLVSLANYAGQEGLGAFPAVATICTETGLSERTVRAALRKLEDGGLIERGNQALAAAYIEREDRRPVVYDLLMPAAVPATTRAPRQRVEAQRQHTEDLQKLMDRRDSHPWWRGFRDPLAGETAEQYRVAQDEEWKRCERNHTGPKFAATH